MEFCANLCSFCSSNIAIHVQRQYSTCQKRVLTRKFQEIITFSNSTLDHWISRWVIIGRELHLTHLFPMHPFYAPWKPLFSDVFKSYEKEKLVKILDVSLIWMKLSWILASAVSYSVKCARIRVFVDSHFPVKGQYCRCAENMGQRKPWN